MKYVSRVGMLLCMAALLACAWLRPMESSATEKVNAGLKNALATYATVRLSYGVVSVMQGTQMDLQPGGVGATLAPGQLLAPISEMLKQFSDVMLLVCVAFGVQRFLISISAYWPISLLLTIAVICWAVQVARHKLPPAGLTRMLVVLLMVQFAVPVTVLGSDYLFQHFLIKDYTLHQEKIDSISKQLEVKSSLGPPENEKIGTIEKFKDWWNKKLPDLKVYSAAVNNAAEKATEHMVSILGIFILQTIIMPLLLLWALYGITRSTLQNPKE